MKKEELKKILRPLIKECIKEVIFEEGILSTIISEVVRGTTMKPIITETKHSRLETDQEAKKRLQLKQNQLKESRKKLLDSVGRDGYNGVDLFEGTTPMAASRSSTPQGSKALDGMSPNDPGVDITSFSSAGMWKKLAGN